MISDDVVEAIDMMIDRCMDADDRRGMEKMRAMLCDWDSTTWVFMSVQENKAFIDSYLP